MRTLITTVAGLAASFVLSGALAVSAQQVPSAPAPAAPAKANEESVNRLVGCVSAKADPAGTYTLTQSESGLRFRLTGKSLREFAGKQVEIVTASGKGLTIRGGLTPSANVAAQAGHLDPAKAAIANQPGATSGKEEVLPEVRVKEARGLTGACK